jgi:5'-deoxynucleotidase YfbR-like HD superfamily hydrolase
LLKRTDARDGTFQTSVLQPDGSLKKEEPFRLDLREMLLGDPNRLRYIVRFGNCHKIHHESVAEHSYYTVLYAWLVAWWAMRQGFPVELDMVFLKAVVHDLEESRSGDFPRPFKYSSDEIHAALEKAGGMAFEQCMRPLIPNAEELQKLKAIWQDAKDDTPEGCIVAFADYLSVLSYLSLEIAGSNVTMREHVLEMEKYAASFHQERFEFLHPLVEQADVLLAEFMSKGRPA